MRSINTWLNEYAREHQHPQNQLIHWICVPLIVWSLIALLWSWPLPSVGPIAGVQPNWAMPVTALALVYYLRLSWSLGLGLLVFLLLLMGLCHLLQTSAPWPLWQIAVAVFVLAWVGQFIGHHIEGKRPAFFQDLQFLLIGPAWVIAKIYRQLGWRY
ncbi:MAG: DUF962 domain-containing protein [Wenzhouxiangellaceae bacterium]